MNANNIRKLVRLLASPDDKENLTWNTPHGPFTWDFNYINLEESCGTVGCLIGLAFSKDLISYPGYPEMRTFMGLDNTVIERYLAIQILTSSEYYNLGSYNQPLVTPTMVSQKLEELLGSRAPQQDGEEGMLNEVQQP